MGKGSVFRAMTVLAFGGCLGIAGYCGSVSKADAIGISAAIQQSEAATEELSDRTIKDDSTETSGQPNMAEWDVTEQEKAEAEKKDSGSSGIADDAAGQGKPEAEKKGDGSSDIADNAAGQGKAEAERKDELADVAENGPDTEESDPPAEAAKQRKTKPVTDLSGTFDVILKGADKELIAGYPIDETFLLWLNAQYGDEMVVDLASCVSDGTKHTGLWHDIFGESMHMLWMRFCDDMGYQRELLDEVYEKEPSDQKQTVLAFAGSLNFAEHSMVSEYMAQQPNGLADCISQELLLEMQNADIMHIGHEFVYGSSQPADEIPASGSNPSGDEIPASGSNPSGDEIPASGGSEADNEASVPDGSEATDATSVSGGSDGGTFAAAPQKVTLLPELGTDIVTVIDHDGNAYGADRMQETRNRLMQGQIPSIGAGETVFFEINGRKIAYVSAANAKEETPVSDGTAVQTETQGLAKTAEQAGAQGSIGTAEQAGTQGSTKTAEQAGAQGSTGTAGQAQEVSALMQEEQQFLAAITAAKKSSDYVIAIAYWGTEGALYADALQKNLAQECAKAGADAIIGCHSHRLQGAAYADGVPVVYGLGNFLFSNGTLYTAIAQLIISEDGSLSLRYLPCVQQGMQTRLITDDQEKQGFYHYLASISSNVGIDAMGNVYNKAAENYPADTVLYAPDISTTLVRGVSDNEGRAVDGVGNLK